MALVSQEDPIIARERITGKECTHKSAQCRYTYARTYTIIQLRTQKRTHARTYIHMQVYTYTMHIPTYTATNTRVEADAFEQKTLDIYTNTHTQWHLHNAHTHTRIHTHTSVHIYEDTRHLDIYTMLEISTSRLVGSFKL